MNMLFQLELQSAQPSVPTVYSWNKCNRIMDIGRRGQFLSHILNLPGCENKHGLLLDFPDVIERAKVFLSEDEIPDHIYLFIYQLSLHS